MDHRTVHGLTPAGISHRGLMLLGFQRTKQISRRSRLAWEAGDPAPLDAEIRERGAAVFDGAAAEIHAEYVPIRDCLRRLGRHPARVIDIGCGQAINDAFLWRDFAPDIILVDIEETPAQYHHWAAEGSGYAALSDSVAFLVANGVPADRVAAINPLRAPERMERLAADLVTSLFSCGFHYPIGSYADLMGATIAGGGAVILDLRLRYLRRPDPALERLMAAGRMETIIRLEKSERVIFTA
jgi:hypothetical protein